MVNRQNPLLVVALVLSVIGVIGVMVTRSSILRLSSRTTKPAQITVMDRGTTQAAESYRQQRDNLSKMLNEVKQELAVMSCEMIELKRRLNEPVPRVSASGGWCKKTSYSNSGSHAFDKRLAEELSLLFANQTVASFGDGPGDYKKYIDETHRVRVYDAYDGAPYGPETSGGVVRFLDLTAPQYGLPVYDWVISLEVAEHIPSKYESIYVDNVVRHAGSGLVLSWAVPGQGGLAHVNNRPLKYVQSILSEKGFETDSAASDRLRNKATLQWLQANVYVYRRRQNTIAYPTNA